MYVNYSIGFGSLRDIEAAQQVSWLLSTLGIQVIWMLKKGKQTFILIFSKEFVVAVIILLNSQTRSIDEDTSFGFSESPEISDKEMEKLVESSSILTQNDEFEFLESNTKKIILTKDTSGSFFTEGFSPPLPRRPSSTGSQTATGMSRSNPGQGGGNSNPGSGSEAGGCSSNPTSNPKIAPEVSHLTPQGKKKKNDQCPVDSIGEPSKGPSSEMIINSNH
jgi:hypothetical protein